MVKVAGWDIGGANCKAFGLDYEGGAARTTVSLSRPFAVWKEPDRLAGVISAMAAELGPVSYHALTMTAELCDVFASKPEGVRFVIDAARQAFGGVPLRVWTTEGRFRFADQLLDRPLLAAATNWLATGSCVARRLPRALIIDVGTTTTDLIPIDEGRVAAAGRDDPGRLGNGELVYTGMVRTPICAVAPSLYVDGRSVRLAAEWFAVTGDAYVILGLLDPTDYALPAPDGRTTDPCDCARRLARMVCTDAADLDPAKVEGLARQVMEEQLTTITRAALQVLSRLSDPWMVPVVAAGLGRSLVHRVAQRLGLTYLDLEQIGLEGGQAAPAGAVAHLLAEEVCTWSPFHNQPAWRS